MPYYTLMYLAVMILLSLKGEINIYICLLNHFAVDLKFSQHCESTIFQQKLKQKIKSWAGTKCAIGTDLW